MQGATCTKLCNNMTFLEKSLFNFTTLMTLKPTKTKRMHNAKKSIEMKYFRITETVSVKFPFGTPLLVYS